MSKETGLSSPSLAREHARSKHGTTVREMPTLPASNARDLPAGVLPGDVVWDETLGAGGYASRVLKRHTRLRLTNLEGDACVGFLAYNADRPFERLNVADTVKVQWNAYLGEGKLLLSDMGRVLMSMVKDTCAMHDTFCGGSSEKSNARKYGQGANYSPFPNARDRFLLALAKHGLARKDIPANINLFKNVKVDDAGGLNFVRASSKAGDFVELRAEMNVLVVVANCPHVLDDRPTYTCTPVRLTAWKGAATAADDPIRTGSPEALRAFENVEDYFNM